MHRPVQEDIPRRIHYCWFGGKEKPAVVERCMASWSRHLPHYEMIEWNEHTFNVSSNAYVREAYDAGKYAFVSDYVRVYALYQFGGIYLDTDVEVFKAFDDLLAQPSFWGFEQGNYIATSTIGAAKGNPLIKRFLDSYRDKAFRRADGTFHELTNVAVVTEMLREAGLKLNGEFQEIAGIGAFYPQTYFSPYDYINCQTFLTKHTYTMHHFYKSWLPPAVRLKGSAKAALAKMIGGHNVARIRSMISKAR